MLFATAGQFPLFLWMVGAGVAVGALYSLCAGLRRLLSAGFWLTLAADAFFGLAAALTLIAALLLGCDGRLRLFELLGAAVGFCLYWAGFAPLLRSAVLGAARMLRRIFVKISINHLIKVIFR